MTDIILARPFGSDDSDADLLDSIARGEEDSLVEAYERHRGCVRDLAGRLFGHSV
jgi:hypothetical protein